MYLALSSLYSPSDSDSRLKYIIPKPHRRLQSKTPIWTTSRFSMHPECVKAKMAKAIPGVIGRLSRLDNIGSQR